VSLVTNLNLSAVSLNYVLTGFEKFFLLRVVNLDLCNQQDLYRVYLDLSFVVHNKTSLAGKF